MRESVYDKMTRSEKVVADLLKEMGIKWRYEHPVFIWDENRRPRVWAPDFYLVPFGVYIEVCGSSSFDYEYRRKILDKNGVRVIFLHLYKHKTKWKKHLLNYLEFFVNSNNSNLERILKQNN